MDASSFTRDASRVHADLKELPDGSVVTKTGCKIYIPERYKQKKLMSQTSETYILAIFAIVVDGHYYGTSMANALIRLGSAELNTVRFGDETYYEFSFGPGETVFAGTDLVQDGTLVYAIFDEFYSKAHIPWFMNAIDVAKLFDTSELHAGVRLGSSRAILELIAAIVLRNPDSPMENYRHILSSLSVIDSNPPMAVPLRSVALGATNTTAKIIGAYADEGLTSALINPSTRVEPIEEILRR